MVRLDHLRVRTLFRDQKGLGLADVAPESSLGIAQAGIAYLRLRRITLHLARRSHSDRKNDSAVGKEGETFKNGNLYTRKSGYHGVGQQGCPEVAGPALGGDAPQDRLNVVVRAVALEPFPEVSPRGGPVVDEKSLESSATQVEAIQSAKVVVKSEHVENAPTTGNRKLRVLFLFFLNFGFKLLALGKGSQRQQHLGRAQVILAKLTERFLIDGFALFPNVPQSVLGDGSEIDWRSKPQNPEDHEERKKEKTPDPTPVN